MCIRMGNMGAGGGWLDLSANSSLTLPFSARGPHLLPLLRLVPT